MGDGVLPPVTMLQPPPESLVDLDYLDDHFLDGCWWETATDGSDFLLNSPSRSNPLFDSSFSWPTLGASASHSTEPNRKDIINVSGTCSQSEIHSFEACQVVRRCWIGPSANPSSVMERLIRVLMHIRDSIKHKDALIQIWVPVNSGGRRILTTNDLPFSLESSCPNLAKYREISLKYQFSAEEDSKGLAPGLPGRVFLGKVPEWTPDVRFFTSGEYPRVDHAQQYHVRGTLALPVFEKGGRTCLGVIELVTTNQLIKYRPQLETVCKALEAVDLRSSKLSSMQNVKLACSKSYETAFPEIQEVLRSACEMHKLPLAQTWVSCIQQAKEGCRHSDDNYLYCISPVGHACYIGDDRVRSFHEACSEHHLLKGQGITGGAFMTNQPCFSTDVTFLGKTEYPLSHHARMFRLRAAVAIRLRSIHCSKDDLVLEFFLPVNCTDRNEQKKMLTSLSMIIQRVCHSLRVITDEELEEDTDLLIDEEIVPADISARTCSWMELQQSGMVAVLGTEEKSSENLMQQQKGSILKGTLHCVGETIISSVATSKTGEKRRVKADKTITLQILRQYFAGSLKDAAKNIGVCTTTLKRICRQHGIKRWPSRKIKKVGHSLKKLQLVIDSVQGVSGAFHVDSFYSNFPKLASQNLPGTSLLSTCKQSDNQNPSSTQPEAAASKSPSSSGSQSSISSHSCFCISEQQPLTRNVARSKDHIAGEDPADGMLKRVRREAELKCLSQYKARLLPRSQSQETLGHDPKIELKSGLKAPQKEDAQRVKITYGDEKARFRMPKNWGYEDLLQEIARRFNINDISKFDIKYLDDDSEWVLLTCDADLEECIDVGQSSWNSTIKLCLQVPNHCMRRSRDPS